MKKFVFILLIVFLSVFVFMGCNETQVVESSTSVASMETTLTPALATPTPTPTPTPEPTAEPVEIEEVQEPEVIEEAPATEIQLVSITSPINKGQYATITIQGAPNTDYSITVIYKSGASTAQGLVNKTSDGSGQVSWTWKVGTRTTSGSWPIKISGGGQSFSTSITVQ